MGIGNDPRVKIVNHTENIGAYNNNYFLLKHADGEWFTWLADDDLMHPKFLRLAYEALSNSDALSFFSSYAAAASPTGVFPLESGGYGELKIFDGIEFIEKYSARKIRTVGSYGVFKREILGTIEAVPRFGSGLPVYVDTFIPIVAALLGRVAYRDVDLVFLRTHSGSQSATLSQLIDYSSAQRDFMLEFKRRCGTMVTKTVFDRWTLNFLWWFVLDGWAVVSRGSCGTVKRLGCFAQYVYQVLLPYVPNRSRLSFLSKVSAMALRSTINYAARRALHSVNA